MDHGVKEKEIPLSLSRVCEALCADLPRREEAIRDGTVDFRTAMEYEYLDRRILAAASRVTLDEALARGLVREIGAGIGYARSSLDLGERTYKRMKREVKEAILVNLHLVDKNFFDSHGVTNSAPGEWYDEEEKQKKAGTKK